MVRSTFNDLRCKEVVNIRDGCRLGYIEDIIFDSDSGNVCEMEIPGKRRLFGLFSGTERIRIPWSAIERIGDDIIIVSCDSEDQETSKIGFTESLSKLFNR